MEPVDEVVDWLEVGASAEGSHADEWCCGEVDAGVGVHVDVSEVVVGFPSLECGDDGELWCEGFEVEVVADGELLVFGDGFSGFLEDEWFAHPVLWCGPVKVADFVYVALDAGDVLVGGGAPFAVHVEFGEAT